MSSCLVGKTQSLTPECPSSRGAGTGASDRQGVEAPWPLTLTQKRTPSETPNTRRFLEAAYHQEGRRVTQEIRKDSDGITPGGGQGPECRPRAEKGGRMNEERLQRQARGAGRRYERQRPEGTGAETSRWI